MSKDTPFIRQEPVARKYELSFEDTTKTFKLKILRSDLEFLRSIETLNEALNRGIESYNFKKSWDIHSAKYQGYDESMILKEIDKEYIFFEGKVIDSKGKALVCSLSEIFSLLQYIVDTTRPQDDEFEQEMFLNTTCSAKPEFYGGAMSADLSFKFSRWIYLLDENSKDALNEKIHHSMETLYRKLFVGKLFRRSAGMTEHAFLLEPPSGGYTCQFGILGEDESNFSVNANIGYKTFCHNLDSWSQQLVLLAGFAKICEAFRNQ